MHEPATTLNEAPATDAPAPKPWYRRIPLYIQIVIGLVLGVVAGELLPQSWSVKLDVPARMLLQFLNAIASPLILIAVMKALITANVRGRLAGKMFFLLALNTVVAILVGLLVANVLRPGSHGAGASSSTQEAREVGGDIVAQLLTNIPSSLIGPLVTNNVIGVIIIAVTFGLAARRLDGPRKAKIVDALEIAFDLILVVLHWIITLVPLAVLCKVAFYVGTKGYAPFISLGWFIVAVIVALLLQATYYLLRVRLASWVPPLRLVKGTRDALAIAFSTGSSVVAMPVTYACLREKVGLREESASLGALVGSNFNNDGTALYEAMAALFVAQLIGVKLTLTHQAMVVLTSDVASVGAAGIPEAGLVTMTLVFSAVNLPTSYIALLLPVDWFLDRCRTAINVMGDMNVSCILDGKTPEARPHHDAALANLA